VLDPEPDSDFEGVFLEGEVVVPREEVEEEDLLTALLLWLLLVFALLVTV
jgi:hypothetical protein